MNTVLFIFPSYVVAFPRDLTSSLLTVTLSVAIIWLPNNGRSFINLLGLTAAPLTDKHCDMSYWSRCRGHSGRKKSPHAKLFLRFRNVRHISFRGSLFSSILSLRCGRIYAAGFMNLKIWDLNFSEERGMACKQERHRMLLKSTSHAPPISARGSSNRIKHTMSQQTKFKSNAMGITVYQKKLTKYTANEEGRLIQALGLDLLCLNRKQNGPWKIRKCRQK